MILGLGIDFLETRRVAQELARGEWLQDDGIFTAEEIGRCSSAGEPARSYTECFAAKEAALKALGLPVRDLAMFREAEVGLVDDRGYELILHDRLKAESEKLGVRRIRLAFAGDARQAGAIVILEN